MSVVFQQSYRITGSVHRATSINAILITNGECSGWNAIDFVENSAASIAGTSEFLQSAHDTGFQQCAFRHFYVQIGTHGQTCVCRCSVETCIFRVFLQHGAIPVIVYYRVKTELVTTSAERHFQVVGQSCVVQRFIPPVYIRIIIRIDSCPESIQFLRIVACRQTVSA